MPQCEVKPGKHDKSLMCSWDEGYSPFYTHSWCFQHPPRESHDSFIDRPSSSIDVRFFTLLTVTECVILTLILPVCSDRVYRQCQSDGSWAPRGNYSQCTEIIILVRLINTITQSLISTLRQMQMQMESLTKWWFFIVIFHCVKHSHHTRRTAVNHFAYER